MPHIPSEGSGVLYPEAKKPKPTSPDYRGQLMYKGVSVKLAGWKKRSQYGEFLSIRIDDWVPAKVVKQYPQEVTPKDENEVPF